MITTLNADGAPVRGWDDVTDAETALARTRRRYQQRRCVACGARERCGQKALCRACWEANERYCPVCERVVAATAYHQSTHRCQACHAAYNRRLRARQRGTDGQTAMDVARAARTARGRAIADEMQRLRARGWRWAEIAACFGLSRSAAMNRHRHYYGSNTIREEAQP